MNGVNPEFLVEVLLFCGCNLTADRQVHIRDIYRQLDSNADFRGRYRAYNLYRGFFRTNFRHCLIKYLQRKCFKWLSLFCSAGLENGFEKNRLFAVFNHKLKKL